MKLLRLISHNTARRSMFVNPNVTCKYEPTKLGNMLLHPNSKMAKSQAIHQMKQMSLMPFSTTRFALFDSSWPKNSILFDPFGLAEELPPLISTLAETEQQKTNLRFTVDCRGYDDPKSIQTEVKEGKLIVTGSKQVKNDDDSNDGDFSLSQFKKTFKLPEHVDVKKMKSSLLPNGSFVVEIPFEEAYKQKKESSRVFPQIIEDGENKRVEFSLNLPKAIIDDPSSQLSVTCKDGDVIICAENDNADLKDDQSQLYFYQRTSLPANTKFEELKCTVEDGRLSIVAPLEYETASSSGRSIPIEFKKP